MKNFNLEEYIKNPNQILVLEHYKEPIEYWPIKTATVVMNKRLAISMPETGHCTDEIEMADGGAIRDEDGNLVGYVRVAEPCDILPIIIEKLSKMVFNMKVGDIIDFNQRKDEDHWGINNIQLLGADVIVIGGDGGGSTCLHDLTIPKQHLMNITTTKLQFRRAKNNQWTGFPQIPTVDDFNNDFPAEFMHSYYSSDYIVWEQDMFMWINNECTQEEFKAKGHDIPTKWQADEEMKRLRQIIINETMEDFFTNFVAVKIEFRRIYQADIDMNDKKGMGFSEMKYLVK